MSTHKQRVEWDSARRGPHPRTAHPNKQEKEVLVVCTNCGYERWLTVSDARRAEANNSCKMEAVSKGYKTTLERYGREYADKRRRLRQIANPPASEQLITHWLETLGLQDITDTDNGTVMRLDPDNPTLIVRDNGGPLDLSQFGEYVFERQVRFYAGDHCYLLDYVLRNVVPLEINGIWHERDERKKARDARLAASWPHPLLLITVEQIIGRNADPIRVLDTLWSHICP